MAACCSLGVCYAYNVLLSIASLLPKKPLTAFHNRAAVGDQQGHHLEQYGRMPLSTLNQKVSPPCPSCDDSVKCETEAIDWWHGPHLGQIIIFIKL